MAPYEFSTIVQVDAEPLVELRGMVFTFQKAVSTRHHLVNEPET